MKAALVTGENGKKLEKVKMESTEGFSESWVQKVLFNNADLLNPLEKDKLDPVIPLTREFPLQGATAKVFLDILAVRSSGTPVLIECKLWRTHKQEERSLVKF